MPDLNIPELIITAEDRHKTCIHEAAHAVIHAIGGTPVIRLEVYPEGSNLYTLPDTNTYGVCRVTPVDISKHPWWNKCLYWNTEEHGFFVWNRDLFNSIMSWYSCSDKQEHTRQIRASVCGSLAGPISDAITEGVDEDVLDWTCFDPCSWDGRWNDFLLAEAMCFLLHHPREQLNRLIRETERVLREPAIWSAVIRLAEALAATGSLSYEEIKGFLPARRRHWPPSPRGRKPTPAQEVRHA